MKSFNRRSFLGTGAAGLGGAALAAARSETAGTGGILSYFQRQMGARSVTPR